MAAGAGTREQATPSSQDRSTGTPAGSEEARERASAAAAESANADAKLGRLEAQLEGLGSLMVAYSGGVDSAFLAATAHRVLGPRMLAVLADSASLARRDMEQAAAFAQSLGMPLQVITTEELDR